MKILITGASGNVGKGMTELLRAKHELVLYDLGPMKTDLPFVQGDIQIGQNLYRAMQGCDLVLHTPAWHGIHSGSRTRLDFWRLNVDGTYHVFDTAVETGVKRVVFLSSTAWYGHYNKYGFTKVIGEEICEYYWRNHQIRYAAMRPAAFVPFRPGVEGARDMVRRFINADPDRRDVLQCILRAIESENYTNDWFHILSQHPFNEEETKAWETDPLAVVDQHVPGSAVLLKKHDISLKYPLKPADIKKTCTVLNWQPQHNLVTYLRELLELDRSTGLNSLTCDYPLPLP